MNILHDYIFPGWAISDGTRAFIIGSAFGVLVRCVRASLKWVKRIGDDVEASSGD
jgi:hypothetical protein